MEGRTKNSLALTVAATGLVTSASFFDAFIHTFPKHRFMLGETIGNHIGNTMYSAAPIILTTYIGDIISQEGARRDSRILEICGKALPIVAIGVMAVANFQAENFPGNFQFAGDLTDGLLTIPLAFMATRMVIDRYRNVSRQVAK